MNKHQCPNCGETSFRESSRKKTYSRAGQPVSIELLFSKCDDCGFEAVDRSQSRENKKRLRAREKQYGGILTGAAIFDIRRTYGLKQVEAARMFGGGPIAFSKYENEEVVPTEAMNNLLILAREFPSVAEFLAKKSGVELRRSKRFPFEERRRSLRYVVPFQATLEKFGRDIESLHIDSVTFMKAQGIWHRKGGAKDRASFMFRSRFSREESEAVPEAEVA
jgi:HTH-type transcriptional regulator / antitoxin MqsA